MYTGWRCGVCTQCVYRIGWNFFLWHKVLCEYYIIYLILHQKILTRLPCILTYLIILWFSLKSEHHLSSAVANTSASILIFLALCPRSVQWAECSECESSEIYAKPGLVLSGKTDSPWSVRKTRREPSCSEEWTWRFAHWLEDRLWSPSNASTLCKEDHGSPIHGGFCAEPVHAPHHGHSRIHRSQIQYLQIIVIIDQYF